MPGLIKRLIKPGKYRFFLAICSGIRNFWPDFVRFFRFDLKPQQVKTVHL
ncbi:hypothetical protein B4099_1230 [Heyndrickxia coagulans]|uniref:Uncharacterized protein n=1 Tax=Heyndrickxia coagulans TaxID=1398 RepID=A0A150K0K1_HEYCO|nr:hypothetical protein B4099_1230 [Heyndrickxia coagulans]